MTVALWCVLVAALMPLIFTGIAKTGGGFDNRAPREEADTLGGYRKRAYAAHLNAFEAFPFFAAAVIVAEMRGAPRGLVDGLAAAYIVARIGYFAAYLGDRPSLRSSVWGIGLLLAIAIFISPLWR
jgi:uncharacterized MAPEG superfamily protein